MRISRRTSGGRGEYEISERSSEGITPDQLFDRHLRLELAPGWGFDTGAILTRQGGKRRIRMTEDAEIHPHLQVAAALLMPHPVRADEALGRGAPVQKAGAYAIEHIGINHVTLGARVARLRVGEITLRNRSYLAEELGLANRVRDVKRIWTNARQLADPLPELLARHRKLVTSGDPIPGEAERIVADIQRTLTETGDDYGISYRVEGEDVVPDLLRALEWAKVPPEPPISVEQVAPEETEIKRRTIKEWKRWANSRGGASARFRQAVRRAYRSTCIVCGLRLPPTNFNAAGVAAAHILPWAEYDLDQVSNGLCLCGHHHWAFDEGLLVIAWDEGHYHVNVPEDVASGIREAAPGFSLDELLRCAGPIPDDRLPRDRGERPSPRFLKLLNQSLD